MGFVNSTWTCAEGYAASSPVGPSSNVTAFRRVQALRQTTVPRPSTSCRAAERAAVCAAEVPKPRYKPWVDLNAVDKQRVTFRVPADPILRNFRCYACNAISGFRFGCLSNFLLLFSLVDSEFLAVHKWLRLYVLLSEQFAISSYHTYMCASNRQRLSIYESTSTACLTLTLAIVSVRPLLDFYQYCKVT